MCQLCDLLFVVITFLCLSKLFNSIHVSFYLSKKLFNYAAQTFNKKKKKKKREKHIT